jgi:mevalonate kinase
MTPVLSFHANGKLLLTGEYFVLDGAGALALPARYGQSLTIRESVKKTGELQWKSLDENGETWFEGRFSLPSCKLIDCSDWDIGRRLHQILEAMQAENPYFRMQTDGLEATTYLEFPRDWGLGTSSTLIALLANWAGVNPYRLLNKTFGGSGYDIACALAQGPILYTLADGRPLVEPVDFFPSFYQRLFFVYLGRKQDSREGIARYRQKAAGNPALISKITSLSEEILKAAGLEQFNALIKEHEQIVAGALELEPLKKLFFPDWPGEIKSLGAWGGDFALATGELPFEEVQEYFETKGFPVVLKYSDLIL